MTQSELNKLKKSQNKALKKKLSKLDDFDDLDDIVEEANPLIKKQKKGKKAVNIMDASTLQQEEAVSKKQKKSVSFNSLNVKGKIEDPIYIEQTKKMLDNKESRKQMAEGFKQKREGEIEYMDKDIQRRVQRNIIKNRGLTRQRKRIDANGRVKKRMKFEKMEKKRKNVVKSYEEGPRGTYGGEASGIKTSLDRGIKM